MVRDLQQLGSITGNSFFLFAFLALSSSGAFLQVVLGVLLLFPLSSDPLGRIPAERLRLWPLSRRDRVLLRAASVWFSPPAWIAVALLVWWRQATYAAVFLATAIVLYGLTSLLSAMPSRIPTLNLLRLVPDFGGSLGGLLRKNIREVLTLLDPYLALVLSVSGMLYRIFGRDVPGDALLILSLLVALAMSTCALTLFGLDSAAGFTRYRLLPVRGWQILLTKDMAVLLVTGVLVLPLAPLAGFAAALMAVTVGHSSSLQTQSPQTRWRFSGGAPIGPALLQVFLMFSAGTMVYRTSSLILIPCLLLFAASLWFYGRRLELGTLAEGSQ